MNATYRHAASPSFTEQMGRAGLIQLGGAPAPTQTTTLAPEQESDLAMALGISIGANLLGTWLVSGLGGYAVTGDGGVGNRVGMATTGLRSLLTGIATIAGGYTDSEYLPRFPSTHYALIYGGSFAVLGTLLFASGAWWME